MRHQRSRKADLVTVLEQWSGTFGFVHTTRKHTTREPRFRVILPLSRPATVAEHAALWEIASTRAGHTNDPAPKDASRFWYTPGIGAGPDCEFFTRRLRGSPIDVDEWLRTRGIDQHQLQAGTSDSSAVLKRRAIAYVGRMPAAVSGMHGHDAAFAVARKLAQDFRLDEESTFRILRDHYNARCQPPWTERELRHKVHEAVHKARVANPMVEACCSQRDDTEQTVKRVASALRRLPSGDQEAVLRLADSLVRGGEK